MILWPNSNNNVNVAVIYLVAVQVMKVLKGLCHALKYITELLKYLIFFFLRS